MAECLAQSITIIPQPKSLRQPKIAANFSISPATLIVMEGNSMEKAVRFFNDYLQQFYHFKLKVVEKSSSANVIRFRYILLENETASAYNMEIDGKGVYIIGNKDEGIFYGIQTLIQLLPVPDARLKKMRPAKLAIPYVSIEDEPRFAYRGMHLDVARHFMPVDFIKKYINYLALHKLNTFHWHLTEDQGWRIEIKKYPKLTEVGGWRNGTIIGRYPGTGNDNKKYGGFYTQQQIKEIVKYAADRYITVIPEIELPGHSSAAIAAYPQLSCFPDEKTVIPANMISETSTLRQAQGDKKLVQETWGVFEDVFCPSDYTFNFLQDVIDEIIALFPSQYIHIGGDECPKEAWKRSAFCQQLIKEKGLKDEHGLQSYFIQRIEKYINSKGKKIIGWDEILEGGLAPNATVMSWRGEQGGIDAAKQKHDVIMTPGNPVYFDHTQSENEDSVTIGGYNPIEKVYAYEPIPKELNVEEAKYVLGAQANVWTEYMEYPSKVEYMVFPRMAALSEVLWSPKKKRNWSDFEKRLQVQFKRYDFWKINYSKGYFDLKASVLPTYDYNGVLWRLESKISNIIIQYRDANDSDDIGVSDYLYYEKPVVIKKKTKYEAVLLNQVGKKLGNPIFEFFSLNKATGKKIVLTNEASKNYPGDGAFTLVNGVQNEKGLARSKEFLGFSGTNCEAIIDFGTATSINEIIVHTLEQPGSWIYFPSAFDISRSDDGINFIPFNTAVNISSSSDKSRATIKLATGVNNRYIKINIINLGSIPAGNAGAGNKAWLFVDEIEVN